MAADLCSPLAPENAGAEGVILVVDDEALNRELLGAMLEILSYPVEYAADGLEALERIGPRTDLVLLDVMMPGMDGVQVLQQLKQNEQTRHIPVLMISAVHEMETIARCIEIGAEDYLPKPFNRTLLRARIAACLERKRSRDREVFYLQQIEEGKRRADELLHAILPPAIVSELKASHAVAPQRHEEVAVLFCDIVGFTEFCDAHPPEEVVALLQELFEGFEELTARFGLEKIKTVGDSFMAAAGLLHPTDNPCLDAVRCGLEMSRLAPKLRAGWTVRIGIHAGPVVAGVVGQRKFVYDIWGDTVNTASRVEDSGQDGSVNVTPDVWEQIQNDCAGRSLGMVPVKGKGLLEIVCVDAGGCSQ